MENHFRCMKKIKKSIVCTVFLFILLSVLPMGCGLLCVDSCGCAPKFPPQTFRIKTFEVFTAAFDGQQISPTTFLPYNKVFKAFRVKEFDLLGSSKTSPVGGLNLAYACSPPSPTSEKKMLDLRVINLKRISLGDGTILEPGENISRLFRIGNFFSTNSYPISDFLGKGNTIYLEDLFKLSFTKNPEKQLTLEVSITIQLEDGTAFLLPNEILSLLPS